MTEIVSPMGDDVEPLNLSVEDALAQRDMLYVGWYVGPSRTDKGPRQRMALTRQGGEQINISLKEARALFRHLFSIRAWIYARLDRQAEPDVNARRALWRDNPFQKTRGKK